MTDPELGPLGPLEQQLMAERDEAQNLLQTGRLCRKEQRNDSLR